MIVYVDIEHERVKQFKKEWDDHLKRTLDIKYRFAATDITPLQLFAHEKRPLFDTQFHPESWDDAHPDGRTLLENFFKIVDES